MTDQPTTAAAEVNTIDLALSQEESFHLREAAISRAQLLNSRANALVFSTSLLNPQPEADAELARSYIVIGESLDKVQMDLGELLGLPRESCLQSGWPREVQGISLGVTTREQAKINADAGPSPTDGPAEHNRPASASAPKPTSTKAK